MHKSFGGLIAGGQVIFSWPCLEKESLVDRVTWP